jgi:hypothetical protein
MLGCPSFEADPWTPHFSGSMVPSLVSHSSTFSLLPRADRYGGHAARSTTPSVEWEHRLRIENISCAVGDVPYQGEGEAVLPLSHLQVRSELSGKLNFNERQLPSERLRDHAREQRIQLNHTLLYRVTG